MALKQIIDRADLLALGDTTVLLPDAGAAPTLVASDTTDAIVAKRPEDRPVKVSGAAHLTPLETSKQANALVPDFLNRWKDRCR